MTVAAANPTVQPVRKSVLVRAPREIAFEVFTANIAAWWPLESHHIGAAACVDVRIEPRAGGRWFERGGDGSECDWGYVIAWEPPARVVLAWQLNAKFDHDPAIQSEVEVRFVALDAERTQVELEHRGLEVFGADAAAMHDTLSSPNGWGGMLEHYATVAGARAGAGGT